MVIILFHNGYDYHFIINELVKELEELEAEYLIEYIDMQKQIINI